MSFSMAMLPEKYQKDIDKAIKILRNEGCNEIFIFGSLVTGALHENSDIDFAVNGLPEDKYFKVMGKLMLELENSFDLIDLDEKDNRFVQVISKGALMKIAPNN